jgi:hypothetical protein
MTRARDIANAQLTKASLSGDTFTGNVTATTLISSNSGGAEGGEIQLAAPATGSTISTGVAIDLNGNNFRIFERGGTNRGVSLGITSLPAGQGSTIAVTQNVFARQTSTTSSGEASTVNINTRPWNMPWGFELEKKTISNTVTSNTVAGLTTSFTFVSGRRYKISAVIAGNFSSGRVLGNIVAGSLGNNRFFDVSSGAYFNPSGYLIVTGTGTAQSVSVGFSVISGASSLAADNLVGNYHSLVIEDIGLP